MLKKRAKMRIAILSDIHDNLWKLDIALPAVVHCDEMICCGDLCSPFVIDQLAQSFVRDIHVVFGNNDADLFRITAKTSRYPHLRLHGEFCELERAGKRLAVNHFDSIARPIAEGGDYDYVCFGHNHDFEITRYGKTLALNPGSIFGARFGGGKREDTDSTFLVLEVERGIATGYQIPRHGDTVRELA
jgi:putative phosphoesterase